MPLYEYECKNCKKVIEVIQKVSDPALSRCADCGASVTKLVSRTSFQLKGSGWYATDYKKSGTPKEGTTEKGATAETVKTETKKGESSES